MDLPADDVPKLEDRLGFVLEALGEAMVLLNDDRTIQRVNRAAELLWGYSRWELRGRSLLLLFPPEDRERHEGNLRQVVTTGGLASHEPLGAEGLRKDGTRFPLEMRLGSARVGGRLVITAACRDLTGQQRSRRTERLISEISASLIACGLEKIDEGIHGALARIGQFSGADRAFLFIGPDASREGAARSRSGRERDGEEGCPPCCQAMQECFLESCAPELVMSHEWCRAGVPSLLEKLGRGQPAPSARGRDWFSERILRKETIRITDPATLGPEAEPVREVMDRLGVRSLLAVPVVSGNVSVGMLGLDTTGEPKDWEEDTAGLLGLVGTVFASAVARRRADWALQLANEALERRLAERTRELERTQQQLVHSEKMAALGQLVAGVAHEVNTPLGAIQSNTDTLKRSLARLGQVLVGGNCPPKAAPRLLEAMTRLNEVTEEATARITRIVQSLRRFARWDEQVVDKVDLTEGLESTLTLLHHELKHGVVVRRDYAPIPLVECYPDRINQVFMNLLVNAIQAMNGAGELTIATRGQVDGVTVEIHDTGRGIQPEHVKRIFDPGFTTKGAGVGTGLGLSIVQQIVQEHCGAVEVETQPGAGTTFRVTLPCELPAEASPHPHPDG